MPVDTLPAQMRGIIWLTASGGASLLKSDPTIYHDTLGEIDLDRVTPVESLVDCSRLHLTAKGIGAFTRVLKAITYYHHLNYCPWAGPIIATCLHWMPERETFAVLSALLSTTPACVLHTKLDSWLMLAAVEKLAKIQTPGSLKKLLKAVGARGGSSKKLPELGSAAPHPLLGAVAEWFCNLAFWPTVRILDNLIVSRDATIMPSLALAVLRYWSLRRTGTKEDLPATMIATVRSIRKADNLLATCSAHSVSPEALDKLRGQSRSRCIAAMQKTGTSLAVDGGRSLPRYASTPLLKGASRIVTSELAHLLDRSLRSEIPTRFSLSPLHLAFTTDIDGYSLKTLFQRCEYLSPTVMFVKTTGGHVFGAYLSNPWAERKACRYFGNGESFVFTLHPSFNVYSWVGLASDRPAPHTPGQAEGDPGPGADADAPGLPALSSLLHFATHIAMAIMPSANVEEEIRRVSSSSVSGGRVRRNSTGSHGGVGSSPSPGPGSRGAASPETKGVSPLATSPVGQQQQQQQQQQGTRATSAAIDTMSTLSENEGRGTQRSRTGRSATPPAKRKKGRMAGLQGKLRRFHTSPHPQPSPSPPPSPTLSPVGGKGGQRRSATGDSTKKRSGLRQSISRGKGSRDTAHKDAVDTDPGDAGGSDAAAHLFMHGSNERILVGGGERGHAIELDESLFNGSTFATELFGNLPLTGGDSSFQCAAVEVWSFEQPEPRNKKAHKCFRVTDGYSPEKSAAPAASPPRVAAGERRGSHSGQANTGGRAATTATTTREGVPPAPSPVRAPVVLPTRRWDTQTSSPPRQQDAIPARRGSFSLVGGKAATPPRERRGSLTAIATAMGSSRRSLFAGEDAASAAQRQAHTVLTLQVERSRSTGSVSSLSCLGGNGGGAARRARRSSFSTLQVARPRSAGSAGSLGGNRGNGGGAARRRRSSCSPLLSPTLDASLAGSFSLAAPVFDGAARRRRSSCSPLLSPSLDASLAGAFSLTAPVFDDDDVAHVLPPQSPGGPDAHDSDMALFPEAHVPVALGTVREESNERLLGVALSGIHQRHQRHQRHTSV